MNCQKPYSSVGLRVLIENSHGLFSLTEPYWFQYLHNKVILNGVLAVKLSRKGLALGLMFAVVVQAFVVMKQRKYFWRVVEKSHRVRACHSKINAKGRPTSVN